jgi:hypothetical protein
MKKAEQLLTAFDDALFVPRSADKLLPVAARLPVPIGVAPVAKPERGLKHPNSLCPSECPL